MECPYCLNPEIRVVETREADKFITRRRRECEKCSRRFTTYEKIEFGELRVVKKDGSRESFDSEKIKRGVLKATEKRPVTLDQINRLVSEVEIEIRDKGLQEVSSRKIGEIVMRKLKKLDHIAYVRFASVYKDFQDIESFAEEIQKLTSSQRNKN